MKASAALASGVRPSTPPVQAIGGTRAINGERPGWDALRQRLYWVDMRRPALHAHDPAIGRSQHWEMPAWIGCYGIARDGRLVVALRTGLHCFDPADGSLRPLVAAPYDMRRFCFNDGRCDRQGRLVVGPMYHPLDPGDANPQAPRHERLWRYEPRAGLLPLDLPPVRIANGLAFSPDGRTLYHS
ncbi:MAG: SMP-30/gluconolactonase/LRE family protein, partial [Pseudomonadota bacterium]|nr:SMP-30/gluconolactonase/LRE family protein [Pseudomonadota bacterium]